VRTVISFAVICLVAFPGYTYAQHAALGGSLESGNSCSVCHTSHPERSTTRSLIQDRDLSDRAAWLRHQATGVSAVSLSCLRCHADASVRQRQPEFARRAVLAPERAFLGFDLGDDHMLGTFDPLIDDYSHRIRGQADPRTEQRRPTILGDTTIVIECTTCHDPHDRVSAIPNVARQHMVCGTCHDLATYLTRHHSGQACSDCHAVHGSAQAGLLMGRGPEETCGRCHGGLGVQSDDGRLGMMAAARGPQIPLSDDHQLGSNCIDCHGAHRR
jgi:predicted CXXCH cytochrome family protein